MVRKISDDPIEPRYRDHPTPTATPAKTPEPEVEPAPPEEPAPIEEEAAHDDPEEPAAA